MWIYVKFTCRQCLEDIVNICLPVLQFLSHRFPYFAEEKYIFQFHFLIIKFYYLKELISASDVYGYGIWIIVIWNQVIKPIINIVIIENKCSPC